MKTGEYEVGNHVCWESQSLGYTSAKHGQIVAIVPAGASAKLIISALLANRNRVKKMTGSTAKDPGGYRKHQSYVVEVKNPERGTRLYWPLVSHLSLTPGPVGVEKKQAVAC